MNITGDNILWVIATGSGIATALFWGSFYLGQIWNDLKTLKGTVDRHETSINELHMRRATDRHPVGIHEN